MSEEMTLKPFLDDLRRPSFLLGLIGALVAVIVAGVGMITTYQADKASAYQSLNKLQSDFQMDLNKTLEAITKVQVDTDANRSRIAEDERANSERALKYVPMIETQQHAQDIAKERMDNLIIAVTSLRETVGKLAESVSQTHEDIAVIKIQMQASSKGPHG